MTDQSSHQINTEDTNEQNTNVINSTDQSLGESNTPVLEGEELHAELIRILDKTFSKDEIVSNPYLISQMSPDYYIPLSIVYELSSIKSLTSDSGTVLSALRSTPNVELNEELSMVKPTGKLLQRNTIILRDVPDDLKEEDVRSLFIDEGAQFLQSIEEMKSECGNTFFIRFYDEEVTLAAWTFLRDKTLQGQAVHARIKSESLRKSYYYYQPTTPFYPPGNENFRGGFKGGFKEGPPRSFDAKSKGGRFPQKKRGEGKGRRGGGRRGGSGHNERSDNKPNVLPMAPYHWPPLLSETEYPAKPVPGYKGDYKKYPKEQFVSIVKEMKNDIPFKCENELAYPAILENGSHQDLEILKAVPSNAKVDWLETKQKNKSHKHKTTNTHSPAQPSEPVEVPTLANTVWPAVNSSLVKTPPPKQGTQNPQTKQPPKKNQKPQQKVVTKPNTSKSAQKPVETPVQPAQDQSKSQQTPNESKSQQLLEVKAPIQDTKSQEQKVPPQDIKPKTVQSPQQAPKSSQNAKTPQPTKTQSPQTAQSPQGQGQGQAQAPAQAQTQAQAQAPATQPAQSPPARSQSPSAQTQAQVTQPVQSQTTKSPQPSQSPPVGKTQPQSPSPTVPPKQVISPTVLTSSGSKTVQSPAQQNAKNTPQQPKTTPNKKYQEKTELPPKTSTSPKNTNKNDNQSSQETPVQTYADITKK